MRFKASSSTDAILVDDAKSVKFPKLLAVVFIEREGMLKEDKRQRAEQK
jgi:hypothetical protein